MKIMKIIFVITKEVFCFSDYNKNVLYFYPTGLRSDYDSENINTITHRRFAKLMIDCN